MTMPSTTQQRTNVALRSGEFMNHHSEMMAVAIVAISFQWAHSQAKSTADTAASERLSKYHLVEVEGDDEYVLQFSKRSILNWSNPVFGTTDGGFFIWTRDRRVAAVIKTYKTKKGRWVEQVRSFSDRPIVARQTPDADPFWSPPSAPEVKPLENSPSPASTATARLLQMKDLHRSFSVSGDLLAGRQELRPLPRPLYRYKSKEVIDGAMFAHVQGTGPDMLLILEARGEPPNWYYSLGAIGVFEVEVKRGGSIVWSEPRRTAPSTKPTEIYDGRLIASP